LHHFKPHKGWVGAEGLAANFDRFSFAFGPNNRGLRIDLRFELGEFGFGGVLFLDHFQLDRLLEFGRQGKVVNDEIDEIEKLGTNLFPSQFERAELDLFTALTISSALWAAATSLSAS
jgi:hypothetical protein